MGTIEGFGDSEELFYTINLVDEWFDEVSCMVAVKIKREYNSTLGGYG